MFPGLSLFVLTNRLQYEKTAAQDDDKEMFALYISSNVVLISPLDEHRSR